MLKRYFWGAALTLVLLFFACLGNGIYMEKKLEIIGNYAESAYEAIQAGNLETACAETLRLQQYWNRYRGYYESILPHSTVDDATESILDLVSAAISGNADYFIRAKLLLTEELDHLTEMETPTFHHIF